VRAEEERPGLQWKQGDKRVVRAGCRALHSHHIRAQEPTDAHGQPEPGSALVIKDVVADTREQSNPCSPGIRLAATPTYRTAAVVDRSMYTANIQIASTENDPAS
jgi:hypothetical protein